MGRVYVGYKGYGIGRLYKIKHFEYSPNLICKLKYLHSGQFICRVKVYESYKQSRVGYLGSVAYM